MGPIIVSHIFPSSPNATARPSGAGRIRRGLTARPSTAHTLEAQLAEGMKSPVKSVQRAAEKAQAAVQRIKDVEREERGKAAAYAEVAELERKLSEAKAKLRGKKPDAPAPKASVADTRAWCRDQGIPVPVKGLLPREAVEAYEGAHAL